MKTSLRFRKGFTLVEILIVIAIIALLAAIAIPNFIRQRAYNRAVVALHNDLKVEPASFKSVIFEKDAADNRIVKITFTSADEKEAVAEVIGEKITTLNGKPYPPKLD